METNNDGVFTTNDIYPKKNNGTNISLENFVRINIQYLKPGFDIGFDAPQFFYTSYVCPAYLKAKDTANPMKCNLKTLVEGSRGLSVLCDQPTLIHTMYCKKSFYDDVKMWTTRAIEAGIQQESSSFNYTVPLDQIPAGYYYTTVVHFADGTTKMTDVKVK